jgi:hypothetical protein
MIPSNKEHENLDNEIASFVNKFRKQKRNICHYRKGDEKEIQKRLDGIGYYPQTLPQVFKMKRHEK